MFVDKTEIQIEIDKIKQLKKNVYVGKAFDVDKKEDSLKVYTDIDNSNYIIKGMLEDVKSTIDRDSTFVKAYKNGANTIDLYTEYLENKGDESYSSFMIKSRQLSSSVVGGIDTIGSVMETYNDSPIKPNKIKVELEEQKALDVKDESDIFIPKFKTDSPKTAFEIPIFSYAKAGESSPVIEDSASEFIKRVMAMGSFYVLDSTNLGYTTIPIQNNLVIGESEMEASYNTIAFLGKFGEIRQYSKTDFSSVSVETKYVVEDDTWTYEVLKNIEQRFRKLLVANKDNETIDGQKFSTKPPVINIVYGNNLKKTVKNTDSFNNFFTYYNSNKELTYKNYVVTSLDIEKDVEAYRYNTIDNKIIGVNGFNVKMSLLEVNPNYNQSFPTFEDYWSDIK